MKEQPEARAVILGEYIVRQKATVRAAAEWFGVSKSTVHKDVSERLEQIQPDLYTQVKEILEQNKELLHKLAAYLLEKETITGEEFQKVMKEES